MKRSFDFCMAVLGLALTAPLFAIIAVLIKLDSQGRRSFVKSVWDKDFVRSQS